MDDDREPDRADQQLLAELSSFFARVDPVPDGVVEAAQAAFEVRDLDAQIAELLADSLTQDKELAGVRGEGGRLLTFGVGERFLELDVRGAEFAGYVVPGAPGRLRVESVDGGVEAVIDLAGRFRGTGMPRGPVRFRVEIDEQPALVTSWVRV